MLQGEINAAKCVVSIVASRRWRLLINCGELVLVCREIGDGVEALSWANFTHDRASTPSCGGLVVSQFTYTKQTWFVFVCRTSLGVVND
jgi:hypothetical protein